MNTTGGLAERVGGDNIRHSPAHNRRRLAMTIEELQALIEKMYSDKDRERGASATFLWFCEEVGELAAALRHGELEDKESEFADVLAWLVTLANISDVNLTKAVEAKYGAGCPGCGGLVCTCDAKP